MTQIILSSENDTENFAKKLAKSCVFNHKKIIIYLYGDLGAGKTTFSRYFIRALGWTDKVKSPTYTLMEHYEIINSEIINSEINNLNVYHLDLYRFNNPEELNFLGWDEIYTNKNNIIILIEWPQKGVDNLPPADIILKFSNQFDNEKSENVRNLEVVINPTENIKNNFKWQE
ncbi:MAG: tRNA (adenosine(37)-N6)-threonylcarbamoyltransferase complex ATPase subunit type 1 TsaE [Gammaproteobacteria bacterium]|nr:tRNA (adenosine(37)-N6)-threonylcarbamoyltransferase complex ATPase subunit type 1 TsaE [Gammaproteobacteria bacterium]